MFKAIRQGAQCKSLGFGYRFVEGCSVGENSGEFRNLRQPTAIVLALIFRLLRRPLK